MRFCPIEIKRIPFHKILLLSKFLKKVLTNMYNSCLLLRMKALLHFKQGRKRL